MPNRALRQALEIMAENPDRYFLYAFAHLLKEDPEYRKTILEFRDKFTFRYLDNGGYVGEPLEIDELVAMREEFGFDVVAIPDWPFRVGDGFRAALRAIDKYDPSIFAVYIHALSVGDINVWERLLEEHNFGCVSVPAHAPLCEMCEVCKAECTPEANIMCCEFARRIVMNRVRAYSKRLHSAGIRYLPIFAETVRIVNVDYVDTTIAYKYARVNAGFDKVLPRLSGSVFSTEWWSTEEFKRYAEEVEERLLKASDSDS